MVLSSLTTTLKSFTMKVVLFINGSGPFHHGELGHILHQYTIPHNPQQNGRVERLNGILVSVGNALLVDPRLNHKFWEDDVATANYIYNKIPHKKINNKVPYEVLTDNKVDYNRYKVFGCQAIQKEIRKYVPPRNISRLR